MLGRYNALCKRFFSGEIIWRTGASSEGKGLGRRETGRENTTDWRFAKWRGLMAASGGVPAIFDTDDFPICQKPVLPFFIGCKTKTVAKVNPDNRNDFN